MKYNKVSAAEAAELIKNNSPLIMDVRTQFEYDSGHIKGANLLPINVFAENISKFEDYRDKDILLYCASGHRSRLAAKMLVREGYSKVHNLSWGIGSWIRKGFPLE